MTRAVTLRKRTVLVLPARPPFHFSYTVAKPSHFPTRLQRLTASGSFYRTFRLGQDKLVGFKMRDLKDGGGAEGIRAEVYANASISQQDVMALAGHVSKSYGLGEDLAPFYRCVRRDPNIRSALSRLRGMRNSCFETLYEILNISSMLQNTTIKRTEQMMGNMLEAFGRKVRFDGQELAVFYTPHDVAASSEADLRALKLGYRAAFLHNIASQFDADPGLDARVKDLGFDEAAKELMRIKGIGPYSANIALFQYLKRTDVINFDVWKRKIFGHYFFGDDTAPLERVAAKANRCWGAYQGYAALYVLEDMFDRDPCIKTWRVRR